MNTNQLMNVLKVGTKIAGFTAMLMAWLPRRTLPLYNSNMSLQINVQVALMNILQPEMNGGLLELLG